MHSFALFFLASAAAAVPQYFGPGEGLTRFVATRLVGDGSPHQAYLYTQVTNAPSCGGTTCSVSRSEMKSYTVSWGIDLGLGFERFGGSSFFSGGYAVSETVETGVTTGCEVEPGHTPCLWWRTAHTGYLVQDWEHHMTQKPEDGKKKGGEYWIWAPNSDNVGNDGVCGMDSECWAQGDEWWGPQEVPGGPMKYPFEERWQ